MAVAATSYLFHQIEPYETVKKVLEKSTKYARNWNKGRNMMKSSKLPVLHYIDLLEALERPVENRRAEVQLPFDARAKKKLRIKDREWKKHEAAAATAAEPKKGAMKSKESNGKKRSLEDSDTESSFEGLFSDDSLTKKKKNLKKKKSSSGAAVAAAATSSSSRLRKSSSNTNASSSSASLGCQRPQRTRTKPRQLKQYKLI